VTVNLPANHNEALRALAAAVHVDQVKGIRDKAKAMETYAAQAKDGRLIAHATEIRMRAEIRAGELLAQMKTRRERDQGKAVKGSRVATPTNLPTLSDLGVNKTQSSRWQRLAAMTPEKQAQTISRRVRVAVAAAEDDKAVISAARAESHVAKRERRDERERELADRIEALPEKKYGVILTDSEWRFHAYDPDTGADRAASNHYPTSDLEKIKARDVASIAADDCVLFSWATVPMLPQALEVMEAWGFKYVSHFIWVKDKAGTGYWNRNQHELLLVGTRGNIPAPAPGAQWPSVMEAPRGAHSEKPDKCYELIEAYYPNVPKIELNARKARDGWNRWGNEAPPESSADSPPESSEGIVGGLHDFAAALIASKEVLDLDHH
jgi:N6-adenosine-specific RNA methylase IME4